MARKTWKQRDFFGWRQLNDLENRVFDAVESVEGERGPRGFEGNPGGRGLQGEEGPRGEQGPIQGGIYRGTWNASTNLPALSAGTGTEDDFYKVSVAGTRDIGTGSTVFALNDFVVYQDGFWQKVSGLLSGITYGNTFSSTPAGLPRSLTANVVGSSWLSAINIPLGAAPTITGVKYVVGGVSNGTVRSGLYDPTGVLIASKAVGVAQGSINAIQTCAFDSPVVIGPGRYVAAMCFSSATATFIGCEGIGVISFSSLPTPLDFASANAPALTVPPILTVY